MALPDTREELAGQLREMKCSEDAKRVVALPPFRCFAKAVGSFEVQGMSGPGGVIGWLNPDGTCRRKTDLAKADG